MPLAAILGQEPLELATIGSTPSVRPGHTVLVGIRNLDEDEKGQIRAAGVTVFTMKDIDRQGIATIAERAIEIAASGTGGIHVSFDLDVCDPSIAPGVGTPVRGGLDYRESHVLMELVADSNQLIALDLVEVNPTLDNRNTTAEFTAEPDHRSGRQGGPGVAGQRFHGVQGQDVSHADRPAPFGTAYPHQPRREPAVPDLPPL